MENEKKNTPIKKTALKTVKKKKGGSFSKMSKKRKQRYIRRGILGGLGIIVVVVIAMVLNMVYSIIQDTAAFDPDKILRYQPFTLLDSNDKAFYTYGVEPVDFEEIPQVMIDAIVSAEDARYYEHNGFDIPRIISAAIGNIKGGGISSGASTITQQTIKKNYYPNEEQTYTRKIGEIFLAIQADAKMDKDTILACYLNTVSYGVGLKPRGIKAASEYYFDKEVSELTLPEAAYLAGALNAPSAYDAFYNLDLATKRRDQILYLMNYHGYITDEEYELAKSTKLENQLVQKKGSDLDYEQYQAYTDAVLEELLLELYGDQMTEKEIREKRDELMSEVLDKSLTVHTYMNADVQDYLEKEIATAEASGVYYSGDDIEVAGSIQNNFNGQIVALLGGRDYVDYSLNDKLEGPKVFGYNRATSGKQSPGSSLKPILAYGAGIELCDWPTYASVTDDKYEEGGISFDNWDLKTHGSMSMSDALASSWNIPAIKALKSTCQEVGNDEVIDYINRLGLDVNDAYDSNGNVIENGDFNYIYAIGGWAEGITMVQEAGAYATLVNGGKYYKPHTINYIEYNNTGEKVMIDEKINKDATQAMSEQSAFMIRQLMIDYTSKSGNYYVVNNAANNLGIRIGAKSGTSTNSNGDTKGSIFACFSPDYTMSFWLGKDDSSEPISYDNELTPRAITGNVLYKLYEDGYEHEYSGAPEGVAQATVQLGKEPYDTCYIANSYLSSKYKISGWYKTSNPPAGAKDPSIDKLSSFTASSVNDKAIKVSFGAYDSKFTDEQKGNGLNPDHMYGHIVYSVVIKDAASGAVLHSEVSKKPDFTINYNITKPVQVCGRYQFSEADKLTSNELCVTVKPLKVQLPDISVRISGDGATIPAGQTAPVTVTVSPSFSDNIITITIGSQTFTGSSATFNLAPGVYTVAITEADKGHTNMVSTTRTITITEEVVVPPDPSSPNTDPIVP